MQVVIRVDSSTEIGSGHLMRCLTFAGRLVRKCRAKVWFVLRDLQGSMSAQVRKQGFAVILLPRAEKNDELTGYAAWLTVSQIQDATETVKSLRAHKLDGIIDVLVVDSYAINSEWECWLRPYVSKIMVIDDLANRRHDCDYLLDQNFYYQSEHRYDGLVPEGCYLLLGPRYALLREEFYQARQLLMKRQQVRKLLVFYGGSDKTGETLKAVRALTILHAEMQADHIRAVALNPNFMVNVIVGGSNVHREAIQAMCEGLDWLQYHCMVENMAELMARSDLMLGAGGTTTWERCYMGLPALVTAIADNQLQSCETCARAGIYTYLGQANDVTENKIMRALQALSYADMQRQIEAGVRLMAGNEAGLPFRS